MDEALTTQMLQRRYPALRFFAFGHLPPHLQPVSRAFALLAWEMVQTLPYDVEVAAGLRRLLEAKDCCVRAMLAGSGGHADE